MPERRPIPTPEQACVRSDHGVLYTANLKDAIEIYRKWAEEKESLVHTLQSRLVESEQRCKDLATQLYNSETKQQEAAVSAKETENKLGVSEEELDDAQGEIARITIALQNEEAIHRTSKEMADEETSRLLASSDILCSEYLTLSSTLKRAKTELTRTRQDAVDLQKEVNFKNVMLELEQSKVVKLEEEKKTLVLEHEKTELERARLLVHLIVAQDELEQAEDKLEHEEEQKSSLQVSLKAAQEDALSSKKRLHEEQEDALAKAFSELKLIRGRAAKESARLIDARFELANTRDELIESRREIADLKSRLDSMDSVLRGVEMRRIDATQDGGHEDLVGRFQQYLESTREEHRTRDEHIIRLQDELGHVKTCLEHTENEHKKITKSHGNAREVKRSVHFVCEPSLVQSKENRSSSTLEVLRPTNHSTPFTDFTNTA